MSDNTFQTQEFKENLRRYEESLKTGGTVYLEPEEFTDIAQYYHLHGRLDKALAAIDTAMRIFPGATDPLAFRARVAILIDHDVSEAMGYANLIDDKHDLDYYYIVAEILIADDRVDDAEDYLEKKADGLDPDDMEDYCLDVSMLFADYDVYDLAEYWLDKCEDTDEDDYQEVRGRIAMSKGLLKKSEAIFNSLIDRNPYNGSYWNFLASAQYLSNDISGCIESSDYALAIDPDDTDAILNKGNCLTMLGNSAEALACYGHYKTLQPQSEVADMGMAAVFMSENRLEEALKHWHSAEKLCGPHSSNRLDIYRNMTLVYASMARFYEAFKTVDKLEALNGGTSPDIDVLRGYLMLLSSNPDRAKQYFDTACSSVNDDERDNVVYYIAYCYFDCDFMQEAHDLFRKLAVSPHSKRYSDLWAYLVRTDYELGLQEEFLSDLKKATDKNPVGVQRELSDIFPNGMSVRDFYNYAVHHPLRKR